MKAKLTMSVTLQIDVEGAWNNDCKLEQIRAQALDQARNTLSKMMSSTNAASITVKIVGSPAFESVTLSDAKEPCASGAA